VRYGSKSLSTGQNKDVAHESIWGGTFGRSTSLLKWQSNTFERMFLSSHNPKINAKDNKFVSSLGAPFYQQFKKPVRKLQQVQQREMKKMYLAMSTYSKQMLPQS